MLDIVAALEDEVAHLPPGARLPSEHELMGRFHANRADPAPGQPVDLEIVNDGPLADAGDTLIAFMRGVLGERKALDGSR